MTKRVVSLCTGIVCTVRALHDFGAVLDRAMFTKQEDAEAWAEFRIEELLSKAKERDPSFDAYSIEADYIRVPFDPVVIAD